MERRVKKNNLNGSFVKLYGWSTLNRMMLDFILTTALTGAGIWSGRLLGAEN